MADDRDVSNNIVDLKSAMDNPSKRLSSRRKSGTSDRPPPKPVADDPSTWPVTPLGVRGDRHYFLDAMRQLREMKASEFGRLGIKGLFGHRNHQLEEIWPRLGKKGAVQGADYDDAASHLIAAAARKGVWDAFGRTRGSGSWLSEDDESLILHCGDAIFCDGEWIEPGVHGQFVYPADKRFPRPWETKVAGGSRGPGRLLLDQLQSWNWKRGELDAMLLLGWIGAALIGGAIGWRPVVWITGGRGTGKSTLHRLLELLFDKSLIMVSDASAAGIWQKLGHSTLPVALDEVEAESDNRRGQGLIKFARQAASGGLVLRGGADHGASEFTARSCFLFSSILIPPLLPQDRSRMAILELGELRRDGGEPELDARQLREVGQRLLRRIVDGWRRWNSTLSLYREALMEVGHGARGADVFGTLLTAADILLDDGEPNHDAIEALAEQLNVKSLAESEDDAREEERCLQHLSTRAIPLDGIGQRRLIAEWIRRASGLESDAGGELASREVMAEAQRMLGRYGLAVKREGDEYLFAIASYHAELQKLYEGTHWSGQSGGVGVWTQALRRLPGAKPSGKTVWFAGTSGKATFLPLLNVMTDPEPSGLDAPGELRFGRDA